jgi:F-type H+-transporting ATPase subunit b
MPQINQFPEVFASQLFWLAVFFGLVFFVIGRGMLPKIQSTAVSRQQKIADDLAKAQAARLAADETEASWRARTDAARAEAARLAQQAQQESAREAEVRIKKALDEIDANVDRARARIRASVEASRAEIEAVAAEAAQQMVEQLIGVKIDSKDAAKAVSAEFEFAARRRGHKQDLKQERERPREASMVS